MGDDVDDDWAVMRNEARATLLRASNAVGRNGEFHPRAAGDSSLSK